VIGVPTFALEDGEHSPVTQGLSLSKNQLGDDSELAFELHAVRRGWTVATPRASAQDFDAIVKRPNYRPIVVQVKRAWATPTGGYSVPCCRRRPNGRVSYSKDAFDVLAAHLPDSDQFVFFTRTEIGDSGKLSFLPASNRKNARRSDATVADRLPDNWELLDQVAAIYSQESQGVSQQMSDPLP
jgi:hypothetical protein